MEFKDLLIQKINDNLLGLVFTPVEFREELSLTLNKKDIVRISRFLKDDSELSFNLCEDITAIDWARRTFRFTIVYHLFSMNNKFRLRLKCDVDEEDCAIDSVSSVWKTADWEERETYDMYGIHFNNHPDLRRMYMPEDFEYYPLRKDFPLMGIPGSLPLPKK
ncbi:MAG: NADH-quinone oxidoreductase subunit C [Ignavibacteriaceae bacterium]|nr:NADH-quinone oxidoreductase subunit C [Ignavibacteriaceae bacterium]